MPSLFAQGRSNATSVSSRPWGRLVPAVLAVVLLLWSVPQDVLAQALESVRVRSGDHGSYSRVVFDWTRKVPYTLTQKGGVVTVTFDKEANLAVQRLNSRPPVFLGAIRAAAGGGKSVAVFTVPPKSKVRHFYSGNKVVLDIQEPPVWQDPPKLPKTVPLPKTAEKPKQPNAKQAAKTKQAQPQKLTPPKPLAPASTDAKKKPEKAAPKAATQQAAAPGAKTPASKKPLSLVPAKPAPDAQAADQKSAGGGTETASSTASDTRSGTAAAEGAPTGQPAGQQDGPPEPAKASVTSGADANTVTLRLDWDEPVAAAVFRRNGALWLAFDKRTDVDLPSLQQAAAGAITQVEQLRIPQATVLRLQTPKGINPSVRRDGLAWLLDFKTQPLEAKSPLNVTVEPDSPVGARVIIPLPEPGKVIPLTDPIVGDNFLVVPAIPLGHGIAVPYRYAQFGLSGTAQGVVVNPEIDDLRVRALRQGIEIVSGAPTLPLQLSAVSEELAATARLVSARPLIRILELEKWEVASDAEVLVTRSALERVLAQAPKPSRTQARLDLARFYIANAYAAEALGVLRSALENEPSLDKDREFRLLRGIGAYLLDRFETAERDFNFPGLDRNDEAEFWRAAAQAGQGDLAGAAPELRRSRAIPRQYPRPLRMRLGIVVAEGIVTIGDVRNAETLLESLALDEPTPAQLAQLTYVRGKLAELEGDFDGAVVDWEEVEAGPDRLARFRAAQARIELLAKLRRISPDEVLEEYEKLRFAWRGDDREFNLLRRLGTLYLEQKKYREGLQTLRQAATHFRTHPKAPEITRQLSNQFNDLFLKDAADVLPPVTAIAIYEEFKELTPAGAKGDRMIQKLADRLVGVDLLGSAVQLLEGQVRFRLKGEERARVGARLALVHLLSKNPKDAERVIRASELPDGADQELPEALDTQRRHLLATALMRQNKDKAALDLLDPDDSKEAGLLRTELYWNNGQWADVAIALQQVLELDGVEPPVRQLNRRQGRYVLNLATALTLAADERGLNRVRQQYGGAINRTEFAKAFQLIAARPAAGLISPESVPRRVKEAEGFQTFLAAYQERLRKNPLSAIN